MTVYKEEMVINITDYMSKSKNGSIKRILDILDLVHISEKEKKKLRQVILDEMNENHNIYCKILAYVQEKDLKVK